MTTRGEHRLHGLVAATHTPFHTDGALNLDVVERQAAHMLANRVFSVFVGGTTGESHSLSLAERLSLALRWSEVAKGTALKVVVDVGSNCLTDAQALAKQAEQAEQAGAAGIAALAPSDFKHRSLETRRWWYLRRQVLIPISQTSI